MREMYLDFDIETTRYLATPARVKSVLTVLRKLPHRYQPTRCKGPDFAKTPFSWDNAEIFERMIPGGHSFEGMAGLYKTRDIFASHISWAKGDRRWFANNPVQRLNSLGLRFRDGKSIVSNPSRLEELVSLWLELCVSVDAAFGYGYLNPATGYQPRGEGYCLPRLHWLTFFGTRYAELLRLRKRRHIEGAEVRSVEGSGVYLRIDQSPTRLMTPTPAERAVINQLDPRAFWGDARDDWRAPARPYRQPEFDWSEVLVGPTR